MTVAQRFAALTRDQPVELSAPELLPVRLARAAEQLLAVDGAGISVMAEEGLRVPLGASNSSATTAERLQFTIGEGPCLHAHATGQTVIAAADTFAGRWPMLYDELTSRTPYRAVISVPLRQQSIALGALDLHLRDSDSIRAINFDDAHQVAHEVTAALTSTQPTTGDGSPHHAVDPPWLDSPAAQRRQRVWLAIGMISVHLDLSAPDALAALRGLAYTRGADIDTLADDLAHRRVSLTDVELQ